MSGKNLLVLDGVQYKVYAPGGGAPQYSRTPASLAAYERGGTGAVIVTETGFFDSPIDATLICTLAQLATLESTYGKHSAANDLLDLIEIDGTHWNPLASGDGNLNTGCFFVKRGPQRPLSALGWFNSNFYLVSISLLINSSGLAA
jgi:hypothetical protein